MNIYEIDKAITDCVDEETGEVDVEALEQLQMERAAKIENIALWTLDLAEEQKAIKAQIDRLADKMNAVKNKRDRLREMLVYATGGEKFKTPLVSITTRETKSVIVDDVDKLPKEFVTVETTKKVDKTALKAALDEWELIDGAHIETKQSVTVR